VIDTCSSPAGGAMTTSVEPLLRTYAHI